MPFERSSGILLHPTSLPGPNGIGEIGEDAYQWIDFLERAGQRLWQVLPLGPTGFGDSPYQSFSAFAGNPYLIDLDRLRRDGLLEDGDPAPAPKLPHERVDFGQVIPFKLAALTTAYERFALEGASERRAAFEAFCREQGDWLDDYALFMALKEAHGGQAWSDWDADIRLREPEALERWRGRLRREVERQGFWQYLFFEQWSELHAYAGSKGIGIIGDLPIFIANDSADAWANPELFHFDAHGQATVVAGVPPDYFSATGQRWGNPIYRWEVMAERGFAWWIARLKATLAFVDIVRIDHFRGFEAYWEIPASEPTAVEGRWVKGPGQPFFDALEGALGELPIMAEDLGVITPGVERLRDDNGLPGMKVLQFAFAADASDPYLPHNYPKNSVVYTGTHDNDTTTGWYAKAPEAERNLLRRYLARGDDNVAWELMRLAQASVADIAIAPLQDVLGLGDEARMNTPGREGGNWSWRFGWGDIPEWVASEMRDMAEVYGRVIGEGDGEGEGEGGVKDTQYRQSVIEGEGVG